MNSKEQILSALFLLFLKKGYETVSILDIEEACGISRGVIYHYFKSKESIFLEQLEASLLTVL